MIADRGPIDVPKDSAAGWPRLLAGSLIPFILLCYLDHDDGAALDPAAPWYQFLRAWAPEGATIGVMAFLSHRAFDHSVRPTPGRWLLAFAAYLVIWMAIWTLGVFLPQWAILGPFAKDVKPLRDVVAYGGFGGLAVAAVFILIPAAAALSTIFIALAAAASVGFLLAPTMVALATTGRFRNDTKLDICHSLPIVLAAGTGYWLTRLFLFVYADRAAFGTLEALATCLIVGICARAFDAFSKGREANADPVVQ